jgi:quercetin dioxygenase-like cupin family protein
MPSQRSILLRSESSGDALSVLELTVPVGWPGPPLHHHGFDETFYVLDGELTFQLGDELVTRGAGELVFAPRGAAHALANLSGRPARFLLICTPGGFERRFEAEATSEDRPYLEVTYVGPTIPERVATR